ncbi:MAG: GntR family transcriptional regulator [Candidatus Nanopelagicales bacterium]
MTAQERMLEALRTDVLTGALQPGEQVVQELIAEQHGVSRVPVREALQTLTSEGLITHLPHRGYFVTELSVPDLLEVYRLRELLETEALRTGIPVLTDMDVATIQHLADRVDEAGAGGDLAGLTNANRDFHFAMFEAAGMPRLRRLLRQLWDASDVYRALYFQQAGNRERVAHEHASMVEAVRRRDVDTVIRLHDEHRDHSVAWLTAALRRNTQPPHRRSP